MTIKEVSEKYQLSKDTLRYYEKEGLIGPVPKGKNGQRDYQEENERQIEFVKCMRNVHIPIEVLKKYMQLLSKGDQTLKERREILETQLHIIESQLTELQKARQKLEYKIELYDKQLLEQKLQPKNK